ncbi:MAG TPA: M14 family zinc carboxypeptidase, partial [Tahibacter sp.]|nr:M14 family zinc carboxypeptidase [Tahibacter sp.]
MRIRSSILTAAASSVLLAGAASAAAPAAHEVVQVYSTDPALIARMSEQFGHMRVDRRKGVVTVEADGTQRQWLAKQNVRVETDASATAELEIQKPGVSLKSIPGYSCYRTVEETQTSLDALIAAHPQFASKVDIGDTWDKATAGGNPGYDLYVLKLTNSANTQPKPKFFAMTAIHAREYTTAELNTRFAEWLVNNYGIDAEATWLLDHTEFHLLLQSNPDGRKKAETGLSWRKNTNTTYCGSDPNQPGPGVDLNRNYPFHWGGQGASTSQCNDTYRGPSGGSEPETKAVVDYIRSIFPDARPNDTTTPAPDTTPGLFLDIHSFSQLVLWPWGDTATVAPNGAALEILGRRIGWFNGYDPQQSIGLYPTSGTTDDTAYGELGVAAYTIELGVAFFESCSSFESSTFPKNFDALRYAARTAYAPYKLAFGPDTTTIAATPDLVVAGQPVALTARVDDARINTTPQPQSGAPPVPTTQNVASASYTVDALPWEVGAIAQPMTANDGMFNSGSEAVQATLDTTGMTSGKHLVYVQGVDTGGAKGAPQAVFVDVAQANEIATVHGRVADAATQAPIAAQLQFGTARFDAGANGEYSHVLRSGTVDIEASAPGYMTESVSGVALAGGGDVTRDFALLPNCVRFADNVEGTNPGWVAQSPWGIATNVSGNATKVWTDSPAGSYANNVNASLTSPAIDFTGYADATLRFDHKCRTEAGYDYGRV